MKNSHFTVSLFLVLLTLSVSATTYTWDGGGADSNWSTAENWNPDGVPVSASDTIIQLAGLTRLSPVQNAADPFELNRLEYLTFQSTEGLFSLSGNQIQVVTNGTTQPRLYLTRRATCRLYNDVVVPAQTTLILDIGTYGLDLRGLISGEGSLEKLNGSGGISLYHADNTFSGGLLIHANNSDWAKFNVYANGAMGTGPVTLDGGSLLTTLNSPGGLSFFGTTTHTNTILLVKNSPIFAGMPNQYNNTVTLNGNIDSSTFTLYLRGGGIGTINGSISGSASTAIIKVDPGTWTLGGNNTFTGDLTINNGTIKLGTAGALVSAVDLILSGEGGTFDLDGNSQTVSSLTGNAGSSAVNSLTSSGAAILTVDQSSDTSFDGSLDGTLSLIKTGSGSLTLINQQSTTAGDITLSNGTLVVASGASLGSGANVTVAGGSLELYATDAIADTASLLVTDGATVLLSGSATETVDKLFINGLQQARGTYGATGSGALFVDDTHFSGTGLLYVEMNPPITPADSTWDAEGSDTFVSSATNWVGDTLPANNGTANAIFATAGDTAVIDSPLDLYGITFNRDGNFTLGADSGIISNGFGGISAQTPGSISRTYTIAEDIVLTDKQSWDVENVSASTVLVIDGQVDDGFIPCGITKEGAGRLKLTASNSFDGVFTCNQGYVDITDSHAFGSTNGNTVINGYLGAKLRLYNSVTLEEPLYLHGESNNQGTLDSEGGVNTLSGPVICDNQVRLRALNGDLVFSGGVTAANSDGLFVINSSRTTTFTNEPLNLTGRTFWTDSGGLTVLAVTNNTWSDTMVASGTLRCILPNVLPPSAALRLGVWYGPNGYLDLNGNDQTTSKLYDNTNVSGTRRITSSTPALLTINQDANSTYNGEFHGEVSVLKLGTGTLTITNMFTSTSGRFTISNGTLKASNQGTFGDNSTNIVVTGSGTLTLENDSVISDDATLTIDESGIVDIGSGLVEDVRFLVLDGVRQSQQGTYGSSDSNALFKDDSHFAGSGVIAVWQPGTIIIVN